MINIFEPYIYLWKIFIANPFLTLQILIGSAVSFIIAFEIEGLKK